MPVSQRPSASAPPGCVCAPSSAALALALRLSQADPCQSFYEYACGSWLHAAAQDQEEEDSVVMRGFSSLDQRVKEVLAQVFEGDTPKLTDFYRECSDFEGCATHALPSPPPLPPFAPPLSTPL